jgi:hypothetical protein
MLEDLHESTNWCTLYNVHTARVRVALTNRSNRQTPDSSTSCANFSFVAVVSSRWSISHSLFPLLASWLA